MALVANIAGLTLQEPNRVQRRIGASAADIGTSLEKISPALAAIPVYGQLASIGVNLIGQIVAVFGNNYTTSTGVRWLTQLYQYYVMGNASATSDHHVDEAQTANAQKWFSYVLGVPVYDRYRLSALKGVQGISDGNMNNSDQDRVNNYLAYSDTQGVTQQQALEAVQIAKQLVFNNIPGSWAGMQPAASVVETTGMTSSGLPGLGTGGNKTLLWVGVALLAGALFMYYNNDQHG